MKKASCLWAIVLVLALATVASAQGPGDWTEYAGNPVFGQGVDGPKAYYPSVLYDADQFSGHGSAARYKMWYGTSGEQTGLATSDDGVTWANQGVVMANGYHATVEYYADGFTGVNSGTNPSAATMYYRMWYWDNPLIYTVEAIRYTESPDGVNWYNDQPLQNGAVPIVSGGGWNRGTYGACDVLYNPSASNTGTDWIFTMYYDGTTGGDERLGLAFSSDGITWTAYDANSDGKADPVLEGTYVEGDWDRNYATWGTVIQKDDGTYEMWYSGGTGAMNHGIGYAISPDGIQWTRAEGNPIFAKWDGFDWRDDRTYCPAVLKNGNSYQMWFAGRDKETLSYAIGYATYAPPVVEVEIDIKPGSDPNSVKLGARGVVPVAVLTTEEFDAGSVDPATVVFADASPVRWALEDVDGDGDVDLVLHFRTESLGLDATSAEATLTGSTYDGQAIQGTDSVRVVPGSE